MYRLKRLIQFDTNTCKSLENTKVIEANIHSVGASCPCTAIMLARDLRHLAVEERVMRAAPSPHQPARTAAPPRGWDICARPRRRPVRSRGELYSATRQELSPGCGTARRSTGRNGRPLHRSATTGVAEEEELGSATTGELAGWATARHWL